MQLVAKSREGDIQKAIFIFSYTKQQLFGWLTKVYTCKVVLRNYFKEELEGSYIFELGTTETIVHAYGKKNISELCHQLVDMCWNWSYALLSDETKLMN